MSVTRGYSRWRGSEFAGKRPSWCNCSPKSVLSDDKRLLPGPVTRSKEAAHRPFLPSPPSVSVLSQAARGN